MAMWFNCMRYVTDEPMLVSELREQARTGTNLDGMRRWGYVFLESESGVDPKRKPADLTIRATKKGHRAQQVWQPLAGEIEDRWQERFGAAEVDALRAALAAVATQIELDLPDCLPILDYGLFSGQAGVGPPQPGQQSARRRAAAAGAAGPGAAGHRGPVRAALDRCPWPCAPTCCGCWTPTACWSRTCRC